MLTTVQIAAIVMLLEAFGVGQPTINIVRAELAPTAQIAPTGVSSPISTPDTTQASTTPTETILGAVEANPCSNPISLTPQSTKNEVVADNVPYYFTASAIASCFSAPYSWSLKGPDPRLTYTRDGLPNDVENGMIQWTVASRPQTPGLQVITVGINGILASTTAWAE